MNNEQYIDLHLHSFHSDGLHSPGELVIMAAEKGLRAIAVSDHDSVAGIDEALDAGERLGVEIIPAVELSVSFRGLRDVHLLGYLIDHRDPLFAARLAEFRKSRDERGRAILERINARLSGERRRTIPYEEVKALAGGGVGRPHIARVLMKYGLARNMEDAFERYLEPCKVPKFHVQIADAITEIRRIGGISVLAHPNSVGRNMTALKDIIRDLSEMGLDGLELYSNMCYKEDIIYFNNLATKMGLLVTGGSDFHGFNEDEEIGKVRGGMTVPYRVVERLREAQAKNRGSIQKAPETEDAGKRYRHG